MGSVAVNVVKYTGLQDKECAVDPAFFGLWLLRELDDLVTLHFKMTEAGGRPDCGKRSELAVPAMESEQLIEIDV